MNLPRPLLTRIRRKLQRRPTMHFALNPHIRWEKARHVPVPPKKSRLKLRYFAILALVLVILWAFASCAPASGTVPRHVPVEVPPKAKPVDLTPALRSTTEAARSNVQASGSVSRISAELAAVKLDLRGAVSEADRLRKQKAASEAELEALWQNLTTISTRHDAMARETAAAKSALDSQTVLLRNVEDHLAMARRDAEAKEAEAQVLRSSLGTSEKLRASSAEALESANKSAAKSAAAASKAAGENGLWRTGATVVAVALGLYLFVRFALPLILRAIKPI